LLPSNSTQLYPRDQNAEVQARIQNPPHGIYIEIGLPYFGQTGLKVPKGSGHFLKKESKPALHTDLVQPTKDTGLLAPAATAETSNSRTKENISLFLLIHPFKIPVKNTLARHGLMGLAWVLLRLWVRSSKEKELQAACHFVNAIGQVWTSRT